jgi:hypothetical protein
MGMVRAPYIGIMERSQNSIKCLCITYFPLNFAKIDTNKCLVETNTKIW